MLQNTIRKWLENLTSFNTPTTSLLATLSRTLETVHSTTDTSQPPGLLKRELHKTGHLPHGLQLLLELLRVLKHRLHLPNESRVNATSR